MTVLDIPTSPDQVAPPAYSTLPPPYSVATDEKKDADLSSVVVENDDEVLPTSPATSPRPSNPPASSSASSSSSMSNKRTHVSSSELRVLLYLYRRLWFGVEESKGEAFSSFHPRSQAAVFVHSDMSYEEENTRPTLFSLCLANFTSGISHSPSRGQVSFRDRHCCRFCQGKGYLSARPRWFRRLPARRGPRLRQGLSTERIRHAQDPFHSPSQSPRSSPPPFLRSSPSGSSLISFYVVDREAQKREDKGGYSCRTPRSRCPPASSGSLRGRSQS